VASVGEIVNIMDINTDVPFEVHSADNNHKLNRLLCTALSMVRVVLFSTCHFIIYFFKQVKSSNQRCVTLGADDFLPLFVWVLVQSGMLAAEIEAEYMWGLLHPSLLSGEGGYYLTTLSSAVHVLKNFRLCSEEQSKTLGPGASLDVSN
jgi:hypothetical protein